jgi:hypothetical protein
MLLAWVLTACGRQNTSSIVSSTNTPAPTPYLTSLPSSTASATAKVVSSVATTQTFVPSLPPTSTRVQTSVPHPIATLTKSDLVFKFDFWAEPSICSLPCWNGLTPGVSSEGDVQGFFARLGFDVRNYTPKPTSNGTYWIKKSLDRLAEEPENAPRVSVAWKDGIVQYIEIANWNHPEIFEIDRLADAMGEPGDIKVWQGLWGTEPAPYGILLNYDSRQVLLEISGYRKIRFPEGTCLASKVEFC